MSKFLSKFLNLFLIILLFSLSFQDESKYSKSFQVKIFSEDNQVIDYGDPFDDDTEYNTTNKNCNITEYPEQAIRCDDERMNCIDKVRRHHCSCIEGYITFPDSENFKFCNLNQKKQLIAFLLELCVGFGAGHFYRNEFTMASLKLVGFALGLLFICTFPITAKCIADCGCEALAIILSIFYYLYLCGLAVWYIVDLVYFGNNYYEDYSYVSQYGKTFPLKPW